MKKSRNNILSGLAVGIFAVAIVSLAGWAIWSLVHAPSLSPLPAVTGNNINSTDGSQAVSSAPAAAADPADYTLTNNPDGSANVQLKSKDPFEMDFPASLAYPVAIVLADNRTVQITQQGAADFVASPQDQAISAVADTRLASLIQKNSILESYKSSTGREEFYAYQKIAGQPEQNLLKNWIVFNSPVQANRVAYEIKNADVNINSSGDAEIFASNGPNTKDVSADFVIPRPYFLDHDGQRTDLNWQFDQSTHILTVAVSASSDQYPIALDPSVLKTNTLIATFSGKAISMKFICGIGTVSGLSPDTTVYQTVVGEDGNCWLASNLGTANIAAAYNDSTAYGWLYQWGRLTDGHQITTSATTSTLSSTDNPGTSSFILAPSTPYDWRSPQNGNLWQGVSGVNNPCPAGWRLPIQTEWSTWATDAGVASCGSNCLQALYATHLKLSAAGYRYYSIGGLFGQGGFGNYWSSSVSGTIAYSLYFYSSNVNPASAYYRAGGFTVRCLKN